MRRDNTMYIMNESNYHFQNKFLCHNTPVQIYHSATTLLTSRSDRKIWQQNLNLILSLVLSYNSIHFSFWTVKYRVPLLEFQCPTDSKKLYLLQRACSLCSQEGLPRPHPSLHQHHQEAVDVKFLEEKTILQCTISILN